MNRLSLLGVGLAALLVSSWCGAAPITYAADLTGPAESPPNASPASGFAEVTIDPIAHVLGIHVSFSGLLGTTTASHVHCCTLVPETGTAMVATQVPFFTGFPIGVTSGSYDKPDFDTSLLSTWNPAFVTAHGGTALSAETDFAAGLAAGEAYFNIHSSVFPGGEIRGFLLAVPEPGTVAILGLGLAALGWTRRTRMTRGRARRRRAAPSGTKFATAVVSDSRGRSL